MILGFLGYLVGVSLMFNGTQMLADGKLPAALGLWWLSLPLLAAAVWFYFRDGRLGRPKASAPFRTAGEACGDRHPLECLPGARYSGSVKRSAIKLVSSIMRASPS